MIKKHIFFLLLGLGMRLAAPGATASLPGSVNALCYFNNFFYNLPENDFIHYMNDALLFTEPPDEKVYSDGMREKYLKLERQHRQIKKHILAKGKAADLSIAFDLRDADGFEKGRQFFNLLGLELGKDEEAKFHLSSIIDEKAVALDVFYGLKLTQLTNQLNSTGRFFFKLPETQVPLPWDFQFLTRISGLKMDSETFFETLLANKRFSLLLAILFRLSDDEIRFIGRSLPQETDLAWKKIYQERSLLIGMLVLSNALRVQDDQLILPGGKAALNFWTSLIGFDPEKNPYEFISTLAVRDDGKLNYLYIFSFFTSEERRKAFCFDYNPEKIKSICEKITLGINEKIRPDAFPRLEHYSYYSLFRVLQLKNGQLSIPLGIPAWAKALDLELAPQADDFDFLVALLAKSEKSGKKASLLQKFSMLYAKFAGRNGLLTPAILEKLATDLESKSTLIDFMEKIPLQKPETVEALFKWQQNLANLGVSDQMFFSAMGQSLLEIIAQRAWFAPDRFDYDAMVNDLLALSWRREDIYDQIFAFIKKQAGLDASWEITDDTLLELVLSGLKNVSLTIQDQNFEWRVKDVTKAALNEMLRSQEDCTLTALTAINTMLDDLCREPAGFSQSSGRRLLEAVEELPYPDFSKDAPKTIKDRVLAYAKADLNEDLDKLLKMSEKKPSGAEMQKAVKEFKTTYLLPNLKDFFVTLVYALNAKDKDLRLFSNPNLVRLHDFSLAFGASAWNSGSAPGNKSKFSGYYMKGGLSRLNLTFATNWCSQLFANNISNNGQAQAMVSNVMAMLPRPLVNHSPFFDALLVEFAVELLEKCKNGDKIIKNEMKQAAMNITAGYHFRRINDFLSGKSDDYYLFFSELQQIGAYFLQQGTHLADFSQRQKLEAYTQMPLSSVIDQESDWWGNIFYQSTGSLRPRQYSSFPQEIANLFASGWVGGEMIREFKIKAAYLAYKNEFPAPLLGQFVFDFFRSVLKPIYSQNHDKDYISTYFVIDIMNSGNLKNTMKKLQKEGALRLK